MAHNLASLQRKSFNQSEINKEILRSYEKNGYNDQAIKKRRTHLENSLNDNFQLTKFRKEYCEICLDLDESDVHRRLDIFKDIYKYIAIQNRSSECGSGLYVEISKLKAQASNCKKEITGVPRCGIAGNTIAFICTVFALLILLMFVLLTIGTATH